MDYYTLELCGLVRKLPIVSLGPKLKIASFNLLGDGELVEKIADSLVKEIKKFDFDYLVGPEVKVVPLLQVLAERLKKTRYIVLRKNIMGYMVKPVSLDSKPTLVVNGPDAELLQEKRVLIVDDVVSTGKTIGIVKALMETVGAVVVGIIAVLKQDNIQEKFDVPFFCLGRLPLFRD